MTPEAKHFVAGLRVKDKAALGRLRQVLRTHHGEHGPTCETLGISRQCLSDLGREVPDVRNVLDAHGRRPGRPKKST